MNIGNKTEDVGMQRVPNWLDDFNFFLHMPKFTALTSLDLESFDSLDFDTVIRAMPPAMKGCIQKLGIQRPGASMLAITSFISNFANLTTLEVGNIHGHWEADGLVPLLPTNEVLPPPPASITKLFFRESGLLPLNVLKWFTEAHSGVITSLSPHTLATTHSGEFRDFIHCFRTSLTELFILILHEDDTSRWMCFAARIHQLILPCSSTSGPAISHHAETTQEYRAEFLPCYIELGSEHNCTTPPKH
jgi:hypothetical protein